MWFLLVLIIVAVVLAIAAYHRNYGYWSRRGIEGPSALPLFGNMFEYVMGRKHFGVIYGEIYRQYPTTKYVGIYKMSTPALLVRDLDLVHNVLSQNFASFEENDFVVDKKHDPLVAENPFIKTGAEWKEGRAMITPFLTSSKVRGMFPAIKSSCDKLCYYLSTSVDKELEVKELFYKYVVENVAICAFGLDAGCFDDPNSEFLVNSTELFAPNFLKNMAVLFFPALFKIMTVTFVPPRMDKWLRSIVNQVKKQRQQTNTQRNDFLQSILNHSKDGKELSEDTIVGNALMFVSEGSETSATTLTYAFYELAENADVQETLYEEVSNSGEISPESIGNMKYLEEVIFETLRKHSVVYTMTKICNKPVEIDGQYDESKKKLVVEPGTKIIIPVSEIHMDPHHFEHPEIFDPSRFSKENAEKIKKMSYLAFGEGPRLCPGKLFGMFQVKAAIASVLRKYKLELSSKMGELKQSPTSFLKYNEGGVWIKFIPRK